MKTLPLTFILAVLLALSPTGCLTWGEIWMDEDEHILPPLERRPLPEALADKLAADMELLKYHLADFDGDGAEDVILLYRTDKSDPFGEKGRSEIFSGESWIYLYLREGEGFSSPFLKPLGARAVDSLLYDLTGDGHPELIVYCSYLWSQNFRPISFGGWREDYCFIFGHKPELGFESLGEFTSYTLDLRGGSPLLKVGDLTHELANSQNARLVRHKGEPAIRTIEDERQVTTLWLIFRRNYYAWDGGKFTSVGSTSGGRPSVHLQAALLMALPWMMLGTLSWLVGRSGYTLRQMGRGREVAIVLALILLAGAGIILVSQADSISALILLLASTGLGLLTLIPVGIGYVAGDEFLRGFQRSPLPFLSKSLVAMVNFLVQILMTIAAFVLPMAYLDWTGMFLIPLFLAVFYITGWMFNRWLWRV